MNGFYDVLKFEYGKCAPDCSDCQMTCITERTGSEDCSGVTVIHEPELNFHTTVKCNQCSEPACAAVCPVGAISKSEADGIVRINEDKCIGCGLCTLACQYAGMSYNPEKQKAFKCDLCDGNPKCLDVCKYGLISLLKSRDVTSYFCDEDAFSKGVSNCAGCPIELAARLTFKILGRDTFVFATQGCSIYLTRGVSTQATCSLPTYVCLMTNAPSTATGVKRYYQHIGKDVKTVVFVGDGCASDVGFQPLSGAAERGENIIVIVCDNEGFQATGNQRSGTTSLFSRTATTPVGGRWRGKPQPPKYLPLVMAAHQIPYTATAVIGYPEDYAKKLTRAMAVKDGLSYIHLYCPCPTGWRARTEDSIEISRLAVETNYFPLWEAENGSRYRFTYEIDSPKPIEEFARLMGRFSHLKDEDFTELKLVVNERFELVKSLCEIGNKVSHK